MKTVKIIAITILLTIVGTVAILFVIKSMGGTDTSYRKYLSLEQATKQSKYNLVKDMYAESFNIGKDQKGPFSYGSWHALYIVAYEFQYGVDADNLELILTKAGKKGKKGELLEPDTYKIKVKEVEVINSKIAGYRAENIDNTISLNVDAEMNQATQDLVNRREYLAKQRIFMDPEKKILNLVEVSIQETVMNLANALGENIIISEVEMPTIPANLKNLKPPKMHMQVGNIEPLFK
jgi:uncharacterized membrane protein